MPPPPGHADIPRPKLEPGQPSYVVDDFAPTDVTPELCDELRRNLSASPSDSPGFAAYLENARRELSSYAATLRSGGSAGGPASAAAEDDVVGHTQERSLFLAPATAPRKRERSGGAVRLSPLADTTSHRFLVRRARIMYESLRLRWGQEEHVTRPDLRASSQMMDCGLYLHRDVRIVGAVPGVLVGDVFMYRAELMVLGVHGHPQAGIDFIPASQMPENVSLATCVVFTGGYLDDEDGWDGRTLVYCGSGGRPVRNDSRHYEDQKLRGGNLALARSMRYGTEIRVIRGVDCDLSPSKRVFVYDGLYRAIACTEEIGKSGHIVYKFKLLRIEGQEELGSRVIRLATVIKAKLDCGLRVKGYLTRDLSRGMEYPPVAVFNDIDRDAYPLRFDYIVRPSFPKAMLRKRGCWCSSGCGKGCNCEKRNSGGFAYNESGILLRGRQIVYECGAGCGCPMTCPNRLTQRGAKCRLEVFRSRDTEWGVRSLDVIPAGSFVCEFAGVVIGRDRLTLGDAGDTLSLIDPRSFPERWREWGDLSAVYPDDRPPEFTGLPNPAYMLDITQKRNAACYISHNDTPNLFVQHVHHGGEDERFPHLMVFTMENIPPLRDLSIQYGA